MSQLLRQIRPHQWIKNVLVFIPLVAAHAFTSAAPWKIAVLAFVAFSALASFVYTLNDWFDLEEDRLHPTKKFRPLASRSISKTAAVLLMISLFFISVFVAWMIGSQDFAAYLLLYLAVNILYSLKGKKLLGLDAVCLALLYTLRLLAGGAAVDIPVSFWLMTFSSFFFLSLALLKRTSELVQSGSVSGSHSRAYAVGDIEVIVSLGTAASLVSGLVLLLYLNSPAVAALYPHPERLWFVLPVLFYWKLRVWILARRGEISQDPVSYALRDRVTWALLAVSTVIVALASFSDA